MKIIFNADDFGITDLVSESIIYLFENSALKSTTIMINLLTDKTLLKLLNFLKNHNLSEYSIGLHFNLTCGNPVTKNISKISSLVNSNGNFLKFEELISNFSSNKIILEHIEIELKSQIELFKQKLNMLPSHCDSHKHIHFLPQIFPIFCSVLNQYNIQRIRFVKNINIKDLFTFQGISNQIINSLFNNALNQGKNIYEIYDQILKQYNLKSPDLFFGTYTVGNLSSNNLINEINSNLSTINEKTIIEYMVHPGKCDETLKKYSSLLKLRENEFNTLISQEFKETLTKLNVFSTSFYELN